MNLIENVDNTSFVLWIKIFTIRDDVFLKFGGSRSFGDTFVAIRLRDRRVAFIIEFWKFSFWSYSFYWLDLSLYLLNAGRDLSWCLFFLFNWNGLLSMLRLLMLRLLLLFFYLHICFRLLDLFLRLRLFLLFLLLRFVIDVILCENIG